MSEPFVIYNKTRDASGTFENVAVNVRYIRILRATLFFFYRRRHFPHILALVFRMCFADGRDGIKNVRKSSYDVSDVFVQY
jgi:hypothetical protein